jgi:hypothetical protein
MSPVKATKAQARRYERNLEGQGKREKKHPTPWRITLHAAPDVAPETLAALAALARRVMEMPEDELREFVKKMRRRDA